MKKKNVHYVDNKKFSLAVVEYVKEVREAESLEKPTPIIPNYIAECFLKIAEGLSHKSNFIRYTYKDEMVMDAVENCLKAITNYNIETATRTGSPNAFAYFTQISYYAFLRRLAKEKKQQDVKMKFIEQSGIEDFMFYGEEIDQSQHSVNNAFVDELRSRIEQVHRRDDIIKEFAEKTKKKKGVELFMGID